MSQDIHWPAQTVNATNPSVAPNGQSPSATSSTLVAGQTPGGAQEPLQLDSSNNLFVNVQSSALPAGGATSANQTLEITQLTGIHSDTTSLDGKTVHVDTGNVTVTASALPSGASTSALQTSGNASLTSINANQTNGTQTTIATQATGTNLHTVVDNFPATQPVSGTVTANQGTAAALAGAWPVEITDGTNILGTSANPLRNDPTGTTTQPVSGTVTANAGTGNFTVVQPTGTNLHTVIDSGTLTAVTSITNPVTVTQPTAANLNATVVGTVTANAGTPTALTVYSSVLTVGTSAQRLTVSGSAPASTRVVLAVTPLDTTTGHFFIGASTVTSETGVEIVYGQPFIASNDAGDYWIISDTATQAVGIMEQY